VEVQVIDPCSLGQPPARQIGSQEGVDNSALYLSPSPEWAQLISKPPDEIAKGQSAEDGSIDARAMLIHFQFGLFRPANGIGFLVEGSGKSGQAPMADLNLLALSQSDGRHCRCLVVPRL
jgi:hypothetical protein